MSKDERRINRRFDAKFEISYINENDYLISFTKDISADGMFIYTERPPAVGSSIKLIFSLGNIKKIEVNAKVVWINKSTSKDSGMGVKFVNILARSKDAILKEINRIAVL